jgi:predicted TIM-barrel fold metal-dependent hydrolase
MTGAPTAAGIWAHHAHVFPEAVRPQGSVDALLRLLDACGIEGAVCFAPFARQLAGSGIEGNGWLATAVRPHAGRLLGFGTVDFDAGDPGGQVARVRELGFGGIKLHPAVQGFHVLSAPLLAVYERAEELGLFLSFHTGVHHARLADARLADFDEIAFRFPRLRFSLEHVGGWAFFREAVGVIQNNLGRAHATGRGTVYAGLTAVFSAREPAWYLPPRGPDSIEGLVAQVGADHVIFGLDFPYKSAAYVQEAIGLILGLTIADDEKAGVLGGTLRAVLTVPPRRD